MWSLIISYGHNTWCISQWQWTPMCQVNHSYTLSFIAASYDQDHIHTGCFFLTGPAPKISKCLILEVGPVKQARKPRSDASLKLCPLTDRLTGVKCRASSVAKDTLYVCRKINMPGGLFIHTICIISASYDHDCQGHWHVCPPSCKSILRRGLSIFEPLP